MKDEFLRRAEKAFSTSSEWHSTYEEIYENIMPNRNLYDGSSQGQKKTQKIYDATPIYAARGFVNSMVNTLTPAFSKWYELSAGPFIKEEQREPIQEQCNNITEVFFAMLNKSNFASEVSKFYYDLLAGTACMLFQETDDFTNPFLFTAVPTVELGLEEGRNGSVGGVFRKYKIMNINIKKTWEDAEISSELGSLIKDKPEGYSEFVEGIYEEKNEWIYRVYYQSDKIVERKYFDNAYIPLRWSVLSGEMFGRGVAFDALPDIKTLHKVREMSLKSNELRILGIYTVADSDIINTNNWKPKPGSFIKVQRNGGPSGASISRLPDGGDPNLSEVELNRLQLSIKQGLLDNRLSAETAEQSTAFAVNQLMSFYRSDLAAPFGRIMNEFIYPFVRRGVGILARKGLINLPELNLLNPKTGQYEIMKLDYKNIDSLFIGINILSPIAKMQKMEDVQSATNGVALAGQLSPEGLPLVVDIPNLQKWIMDQSGVPEKFTFSEEEREEIRAKAEAMAGGQ